MTIIYLCPVCQFSEIEVMCCNSVTGVVVVSMHQLLQLTPSLHSFPLTEPYLPHATWVDRLNRSIYLGNKILIQAAASQRTHMFLILLDI